MNPTVKILIADDHELFINGLQLILQSESWIDIIDVAFDGRELLDILAKKAPDIILLDVNMPRLNGLEAIRFIKQSYRHIKLIMLSTYNEDHIIEKAKVLGANGYLLKNSNRNDLLQTIQLVMNNQTSFPYRPPAVDSQLGKEDNFLKQFNITKREREIIAFIKKGFTNSEIAKQLVLSIYTVETHRKNIMQKLSLKTPTALMKWILENNVIPESCSVFPK